MNPNPHLEPSRADLHALRQRLCSAELDQNHLFVGWPDVPEQYTEQQVAFLSELWLMSRHYDGGVEEYIRTGKRLLKQEDTSSVPYVSLEMPSLLFHAPDQFSPSAELEALETRGAALAARTVFVLVAGGLGERLGYSNIKLSLPVETATGLSYMAHYTSWAQQMGGNEVPFVIMTSDDTHARTLQLLAELNISMPNLLVLKQETVPCFQDAEAHVALAADGKLLRKPHGHGDVHSLIYAARLPGGQRAVDHWITKGFQYIAFMQDTNAPAVFTIPVSLAISERENLDLNLTCVPRIPKEPIGLLCRVQRREGLCHHHAIVEYNLFEDAARHLTAEGGDVAAAGSAFSRYPGSINTIVCRLPAYKSIMEVSRGKVPEFINPKYADDTKTRFKKPARIESLMHDVTLQYTEKEHRVGGVVFDRFTFQPVKNALEDAVEKVRQGADSYSATAGEAMFLEWTRRRLAAVGVPLYNNNKNKNKEEEDVPDITVKDVIKVHLFPIITMDAVARRRGTLTDVAAVFPNPAAVAIAPGSTLIIEGHVIIESLQLEGALRIVGPPNSSGSSTSPLVVKDLVVKGPMWGVRPTQAEDTSEVDRIRGFVLEKTGPQLVEHSKL